MEKEHWPEAILKSARGLRNCIKLYLRCALNFAQTSCKNIDFWFFSQEQNGLLHLCPHKNKQTRIKSCPFTKSESETAQGNSFKSIRSNLPLEIEKEHSPPLEPGATQTLSPYVKQFFGAQHLLMKNFWTDCTWHLSQQCPETL